MSRRQRRRAILAFASVALLVGLATTAIVSYDRSAARPGDDAIVFVNPEKAEMVAGDRGHAHEGSTDEGPGPDSRALEEYIARATPLDTIPANAHEIAQETWRQYKENKEQTGASNRNHPYKWDLIGPTHSRMPQHLTFSGRDYRASGRTTALAITPTCTPSNCTLWIGAAGGGIWRTDNPLSPDPKWVFVSSSFKSNAIGTLRQDPSDPTGMTLYAGTGEPNASGDSMAGVGIYKTTNGGNTWTLLPGSAAFATRSIGEIAIDPTNPQHILAGVARGIRGYSSKTGGVFSRTGPCVQLATGLSCGDGPDQAPLGLYESFDGGATFTLIWDVTAISVRGVNDVEFDPRDVSVIYAAAFQQGIWRRDATKGEVSFTKIFSTGNPGQNTARTQFDLTTVQTPTGPATRIYAADGSLGPQFETVGDQRNEIPFTASTVWRVDNASMLPAAALLASQALPYDGVGWDAKSSQRDRPRAAPYRESYNYCTGQCWYDNDVYTPDGFPNVVYVLGSYSYSELYGASNGRGLIMSMTAGDPDPTAKNASWTDMTFDFTPADQPDHLHPDHHELITPKGQPFLFFSASDGGVVRSDGEFRDMSDECTDPKSHPFNDPDSLALCIRLLSRVPHQLYDTLNKGLSTLQFQSYVDDPKRSNNGQGGTQDNGTMEWQGTPNEWVNEMYGDGGNGYRDYCDSTIHGNTFFTQYTDVNFHDGQVLKWAVTSGPLFPPQNGGEVSAFYGPIVADYTNCGDLPQFKTEAARLANANRYPGVPDDPATPVNEFQPGTPPEGQQIGEIGFKYIGLNHVWRTIDNGGPEAYLEANCPEFTTSGADPRCGDWKSLGGPPGPNEPGSLTGTFYGPDRIASVVVEIQRSPYDSNSIWAATGNGRLFVSRNVNAVDPNAVQWCRLDNRAAPYSPPRWITSIVPTQNPKRVFVSYNGYNSNTRDQRGHVFEVTLGADDCAGPVTWRDLAVEQGSDDHSDIAGDIPITDLVRDDFTGDLYASTDFGVLQGRPVAPLGPVGSAYVWTRIGVGLPFVETPGLTIDPCERELFAATHGRSIWRMYLEPLATKPEQQRCPRTP